MASAQAFPGTAPSRRPPARAAASDSAGSGRCRWRPCGLRRWPRRPGRRRGACRRRRRPHRPRILVALVDRHAAARGTLRPEVVQGARADRMDEAHGAERQIDLHGHRAVGRRAPGRRTGPGTLETERRCGCGSRRGGTCRPLPAPWIYGNPTTRRRAVPPVASRLVATRGVPGRHRNWADDWGSVAGPDVWVGRADSRLLRRHVAGDTPTSRLNARENAASLS